MSRILQWRLGIGRQRKQSKRFQVFTSLLPPISIDKDIGKFKTVNLGEPLSDAKESCRKVIHKSLIVAGTKFQEERFSEFLLGGVKLPWDCLVIGLPVRRFEFLRVDSGLLFRFAPEIAPHHTINDD